MKLKDKVVLVTGGAQGIGKEICLTCAREGAKIIDSVLMPGVTVESGAVVTRALVADGVKICKDAKVGDSKSEHIELVAKNVKGVE